jgi:hypothetical protein
LPAWEHGSSTSFGGGELDCLVGQKAFFAEVAQSILSKCKHIWPAASIAPSIVRPKVADLRLGLKNVSS